MPQTDKALELSKLPYRGRFAPTPSGALHLGSLLAAVASYLQARSHQGQWLIRIEDIDPPREVAGSAAGIIADLAALGMQADTAVSYQSQNTRSYQQAVDHLLASGQAFRCNCSRKQMANFKVYPGNCRQLNSPATAVRLLCGEQSLCIKDNLQPSHCYDPQTDIGDFIIWRADKLPAYQLAVVVDDAVQHITEIVRGCDLLDSTPRQWLLQDCLGLAHPQYLHIPLLKDAAGRKLSKRDQADPLNRLAPLNAIRLALKLLGQAPPAGMTDLDKLWQWAIEHWDIGNIPATLSLPENVIDFSSRGEID